MASVSRLVVLDVLEGSCDRGYSVALRIAQFGKSHQVDVTGQFPAIPELPVLYSRWQTAYQQWGGNQRQMRQFRVEFPPQTTNISYWDECLDATQQLKAYLLHWFDQPAMRDFREQILEEVQMHESGRIILQTQDPLLRKLPWQLWPLLERRPNLEIAIRTHHIQNTKRLGSPVRILAILGSSQGLDLRVDRDSLASLPNAKIEFLVEPTRQILSDRLFEQSWDLLFFSGHSYSCVDGNQGHLWINEQDYLSPNELSYALSRAAQNGLQLAMFNSCDGLGLARQLSDLQIPNLIVMREPVPDPVAQAFLKYFLQTFAKGESLCLSVRKAREQLHSLEHNYPCASWLPVICQNPAAPLLQYPQWNRRKSLQLAGIGTVLSAGIAALGYWGWQETQISNRISLGEKLLVTSTISKSKQAGIQAFHSQNYKQAEAYFEESLAQNQNDPETLIYLNNARIANRHTLIIATSVPIGNNPSVALEMLRGVAQSQDEVNRSGGISGWPLKVMIADDSNQPNLAIQIAHRLVNDARVFGVVGSNSSDTSVAVAPIYNKGQVVMITPTSVSDKLSDIGSYVFQMVPSIRFLADKLADAYISRNPHAHIATCSRLNAKDNESFRNQFINSIIAKSVTYYASIPCDFAAPQYNPKVMMSSLLQAKVNTLVLAPHVDHIDQALNLLKENKGKLTVIGSPTLYSQTTLALGKANVNNLLIATPWHPSMLPNNYYSATAIKLWHEPPNWRTALSYDATLILARGLGRAILAQGKLPLTRSSLKDALKKSNFLGYGASGSIRFTPSGERQIALGVGTLIQVKPAPSSKYGYDFVPVKLISKN